FDVLHTRFQDTNGALFDVDLVMNTRAHARSQGSKDPVELRGTINWTRNNQRGSRLIDQDGVNLIDDAIVMPTLHAVFEGTNHVVAQVVKAKFIVGGVSNIAIVCFLTFLRTHLIENHTDREPEPPVHTPHHLCVTARQVVIDGHDVHAFAFQSVEVSRQQGGQGLALTSAHFGDVAEVQCCATHDLHLVVLLVHHAPSRFAHGSKSFKKDVVKSFSIS